MGAGFAGHCAGADDWAQKREAAVVDGDLCVDGLVDCGGGMALIQSLSAGGLFWLVLGGVLYSAGIYWFINDTKIRHGHGIWHLFVLAGSLTQFISIYFYVL